MPEQSIEKFVWHKLWMKQNFTLMLNKLWFLLIYLRYTNGLFTWSKVQNFLQNVQLQKFCKKSAKILQIFLQNFCNFFATFLQFFCNFFAIFFQFFYKFFAKTVKKKKRTRGHESIIQQPLLEVTRKWIPFVLIPNQFTKILKKNGKKLQKICKKIAKKLQKICKKITKKLQKNCKIIAKILQNVLKSFFFCVKFLQIFCKF